MHREFLRTNIGLFNSFKLKIQKGKYIFFRVSHSLIILNEKKKAIKLKKSLILFYKKDIEIYYAKHL